MVKLGIQCLGLTLSAYAAFVALSLTLKHFGGTTTCPVLLGIPACLAVLMCYILITGAWILSFKKNAPFNPSLLFFMGFIPAFVLAIAGSIGEVFDLSSCPATETGYPKCFVSLGLLVYLVASWWLSIKLKNKLLTITN